MLTRLIRQLIAREREPTAAGTRGAIDDDTPGDADWAERGQRLEADGKLQAALDCYRVRIRAHPEEVPPRIAAGNALAAMWRVEEAISEYAEALAVVPDSPELFSSVLLFSHYAAHADPLALAELHHRYGRLLTELAGPPSARRYPNAVEPERRLRVGYVSRHFSFNSVGYFVEPVIALHDRRHFEVYCYYTHPYSDAKTERIAGLADLWRHVHAEDDEPLTALIAADCIDLLVDLGGHTKLNRLRVFANKPAPVQLTWLGYPDTTGLPMIDYRVTDAIADPPGESDQRHSERLLRLPVPFVSYAPAADAPAPSPRGPGADVVFGSFNLLLKVNAPLVKLWARILRQVPGSRLLLKARGLEQDAAAGRLIEAFRAEGISPARLEFRRWASERSGHLDTYHEIDIALDTFPYNGTTTTCEALWMGVPVVTLSGDLHISRVGASLLKAAGLADLIACTSDEYVAKSIALARDPDRLYELRSTMRARLAASDLLDHSRFTRNLESAYREAWRDWCNVN
jgi:protein O-GlcNAc transferase